MALIIPRIILLIFSALGAYALWMVPSRNGLFTALFDLQKPGAYLPGSDSLPLRRHYTGVKAIDNQMMIMVAFFWPALEGSRPEVSLAFLELVVQVMATSVLVWIESLRVGNQGRWYNSSATITLMLIQNLGFGIITPLWMCFHLASSSPTINPSAPTPLAASNPLPLLTLPISTLFAPVLPNVLMSLPVPHRLSPTIFTKQFYTAVSQFWPVLLGMSQLILPIAISAATPGIQALSEHEKKVKSLRYLRRCYAFTLVLTTCSHLLAAGIPVLAHLFPSLFSPVHVSRLQPSNVFVPSSPFSPIEPITSIADGILTLVQWDLLTGSLAVLVWAVTLRVQAQKTGFWAYEWVEGLVKVAALVCVCGPVGAAAAVLWERDELVFQRGFEAGSERKDE